MKNLSRIHLKLLDAAAIVNRVLSPLMIFSFALTFCMFCVFLFTLFIYAVFWVQYPWFGLANFFLNIHMYFVMLGVLWVCETTVKEERRTIKLLFQVMADSGSEAKNKTVKYCFDQLICYKQFKFHKNYKQR